jgi:flavin-dependent dehydrogenase
VFPKHDGTANVGAGFFGVRNIPAISVLDTFMKTHFPRARIIAKTAGCAPVTPCPKRLHRDNVLVVGDAARQVNPLIAGGIMNALEASHLCTAHLVRALESDSPQAHLARYSRQWQRGQRRQQLFFESVKRMLLSGSTAQVYRLLEKSYSFFTTHVARTTPFRIPLWPTARFLVSILPRYLPHARHLLR